MVQSGADGGLMSEIAGKLQRPNAAVPSAEFGEHVWSGIPTAIVHKDQFRIAIQRIQDLRQSAMDRRDVFRFIVAGQNDGQFHGIP
jgi:hypothetical protein